VGKFQSLRVHLPEKSPFGLNGTVLALRGNPIRRFAAQQPGQGTDVEKTVAVLDPDKEHSRELCSVLEKERYRVLLLPSAKDLDHLMQEGAARALILDIDSVPMDNRTLKELRKDNPDLCIIVLSNRSFHPELKEALSRSIDACFAKPVEWEDLLYYLRGALKNGVKRGPP
jgi:DNA-binding response OmpR family regulator